jgi:lysophospholipase
MSASPDFPDLPQGWSEEIQGTERVWSCKKQNLKSLLVVHGFGENSNRYRHLPFYLQNQFSKITALDLPGHGTSPEKKGDCDRFSDFTDRVTKSLKPEMTHILGHSFGGLVVLKLLKMDALKSMKSVLVSAPLLKLAVPAPALKAFAGRLIEPLLPHLQLENEIDPSVVSRDLKVVDWYSKESLNHSKITPRTFVEMTKAMKEISQWKGPLQQKFGLILPFGDRLVDPSFNFKFFNELQIEKSGSKQLLGFPGFFHESMNDLGKGLVFNALEDFYSKL